MLPLKLPEREAARHGVRYVLSGSITTVAVQNQERATSSAGLTGALSSDLRRFSPEAGRDFSCGVAFASRTQEGPLPP